MGLLRVQLQRARSEFRVNSARLQQLEQLQRESSLKSVEIHKQLEESRLHAEQQEARIDGLLDGTRQLETKKRTLEELLGTPSPSILFFIIAILECLFHIHFIIC